MKHVVMFSFGESSWYEARLAVRRYGKDSVLLLFADTKGEDEDTYRWGRAAAKEVGAELVEISDGRTIWELFRAERMIGNTRADLCSRVLKRELCRKWVETLFKPEESEIHVGISLFESERMESIRRAWQPYRAVSLLLEPPCPGPGDIRKAAIAASLGTQRLYLDSFRHANCGGACVKAGHAQWAHLLRMRPERYRQEEEEEEMTRQRLGKDVAILRDRTGGSTRPMTLRTFRERLERNEPHDLFDWGACSCFAPAPASGEDAA